jgi:hypothetical protein
MERTFTVADYPPTDQDRELAAAIVDHIQALRDLGGFAAMSTHEAEVSFIAHVLRNTRADGVAMASEQFAPPEPVEAPRKRGRPRGSTRKQPASSIHVHDRLTGKTYESVGEALSHDDKGRRQRRRGEIDAEMKRDLAEWQAGIDQLADEAGPSRKRGRPRKVHVVGYDDEEAALEPQAPRSEDLLAARARLLKQLHDRYDV